MADARSTSGGSALARQWTSHARMESKLSKLDPRVYQVTIRLETRRGGRTLTVEQGAAVIDQFEAVAHQATKWRLMTQRAGTLLLIDPELVSQIEEWLER
jgi:hypothetical protein